MKSSKITRIPSIAMYEAEQIKKAERLKSNSDGFRRMVAYARIGREFSKTDLLTANAKWFNIKLGKEPRLKFKKRGKK